MPSPPFAAELPDRDRLLAMAQRVARVGGWALDLPSRRLAWTDEVAAIHGWPAGAPVGAEAVLACYVEDSRARLRARLAEAARGGAPFDERLALRTPGGRDVWVRTIGEAVRDRSGRVVRLQGAVQDITEQRRTELALERASARLSSTLESISDAFFTLDTAWRFTYLNSEAERLLQRPRSALLGRELWTTFPEAVGTAFHAQYTRALAERAVTEFEAHYPPFAQWFSVKAYPVPDGLAVSFRDATAARRAQEQLRLLQTSVERLNDIVIITDAEPITGTGPRIVYVNEAFERLTGYRRDEVIGRTPRLLQGPGTDRRTLDAIRQALGQRQPVRAELLNYTKAGAPLWLELDIVPLADATGRHTHWVSVERDVTERRRLQAQVLRAQRLESIGTLAGGLAHDLNNVLSPIQLAVELLRPLVTDEAGRRRLDVIAQASARGASMVRQVLGFARGVEGARAILSLASVMEETLRIVGETFPRTIVVDAQVAPDAACVEGDATQLQQVLLNLCVNARDAMPAGGRLTVSLANVPADEPVTAAPASVPAGGQAPVPPGARVCLTVRDTGVGILPEHLEAIFDPFFTTKPPGQGTGLGLATTLAIVRAHGGTVRVDSTPGAGTSVAVFLPAADAPAERPADEPPEPAVAGAGETVLVVDDEAPIRATVRDVLESHGYRVLEAVDGADAITVFAEHAADVRVVFTDLTMPVMDGRALIEVLRTLAPRVPLIATSGVATAPSATREAVAGFLAKPYAASDLLRAVARALRG
jgi:PAS domain S-box-containing protein